MVEETITPNSPSPVCLLTRSRISRALPR